MIYFINNCIFIVNYWVEFFYYINKGIKISKSKLIFVFSLNNSEFFEK